MFKPGITKKPKKYNKNVRRIKSGQKQPSQEIKTFTMDEIKLRKKITGRKMVKVRCQLLK